MSRGFRTICIASGLALASSVVGGGVIGSAASRPARAITEHRADFNGDGFSDLAVGVPNEDVNGHPSAGAVNVLYGGAGGLTANGDQLWNQDSGGVLDFAEDSDHFGYALAAGNFNDDAFDDLAIGVPFEDIGTTQDAGAVNVLYGSSAGLTANLDQFWDQSNGALGDQEETNDGFGHALTAGDYDGDGFDDLAVAADFEDVGTVGSAGAVNVIYGASFGLGVAGDQFWTQDSPGVNDAAEDLDRFGQSVATGNFDGDPFDDLAIGVLFEDAGTTANTGAVAVLYGASTGLSSAGDQLWTQNSSGIADVAENQDFFGVALAAGDIDGSGQDDLVIGVQYENVGTIADAGAVNVIYGSSAGLSSTDDEFWSQNSSGVADSSETADFMGWSVAVGDFDGDGFADMAAGDEGEDISATVTSAGAVTVLYGTAVGLTATGDLFLSQDSGGVAGSSEAGDNFGYSVVALDFGNGPQDDLSVGAPDEGLAGVVEGGAVNTVYGSSGIGLTSAGNQLWDQDTSGVLGSAAQGDNFGQALAAG